MKHQTAEVLALLKRNKRNGITSLDAMRELQVWRLAARIHELRAEGYEIWTVAENHGRGTHARYFLAKSVPV